MVPVPSACEKGPETTTFSPLLKLPVISKLPVITALPVYGNGSILPEKVPVNTPPNEPVKDPENDPEPKDAVYALKLAVLTILPVKLSR
jgi:hypothetical protein